MKVIIIGGGLSGIAASVFLSDTDYDITIVESTLKLGGRTFSIHDKDTGIVFDNGQHILAGWYDNTFELFKLMGKTPQLNFSDNLEVHFREQNGKEFSFVSKGDNPLLAAAKGFMNYPPLNFRDKLHLLSLRELIEIDIAERLLKGRNLTWLLDHLKQTDNLKKYFWNPFVYAVFNTSPEYVDAVYFLNVLSRAFDKFGGTSLIIPDESLESLFIEPFINKYSDRVTIRTSSKVSSVIINEGKAVGVMLENGEKLAADVVISTVPFHSFGKMFSTEVFSEYFDLNELTPASIISVYLVPDKMPDDFHKKYYYGMVGMLNTDSHWVFFKKNCICIVISAPEFTVEGYNEDDKDGFLKKITGEFKSTFPEFKDADFIKKIFFREKRATFLPQHNTTDYRPDTVCKVSKFFIGGDWTNTGLPATIESAVLSGKKCAEAAKN